MSAVAHSCMVLRDRVHDFRFVAMFLGESRPNVLATTPRDDDADLHEFMSSPPEPRGLSLFPFGDPPPDGRQVSVVRDPPFMLITRVRALRIARSRTPAVAQRPLPLFAFSPSLKVPAVLEPSGISHVRRAPPAHSSPPAPARVGKPPSSPHSARHKSISTRGRPNRRRSHRDLSTRSQPRKPPPRGLPCARRGRLASAGAVNSSTLRSERFSVASNRGGLRTGLGRATS